MRFTSVSANLHGGHSYIWPFMKVITGDFSGIIHVINGGFIST